MAKEAISEEKSGKKKHRGEERASSKAFAVSDRRHWARRQEGEELKEPVEPSERLPNYVERLKAQMEEKDATLREYISSYKKMKEEMEAARARLGKDMERRLELHKLEFFSGLLPILDNLDRAVAAAEGHQDHEGLLKGVAMVRDLFLQKLQAQGIERMQAVGEAFDPKMHEAMAVVEVEPPEEDNTVVEELSPGYLYKDTLLRAAQVKVSQRAAGSAEGEQGDNADI